MCGNCKSEAQIEFEKALASNVLSREENDTNFVGYYMYMGTENGKAQFKNSLTREYLKY